MGGTFLSGRVDKHNRLYGARRWIAPALAAAVRKTVKRDTVDGRAGRKEEHYLEKRGKFDWCGVIRLARDR